MNMKVGFIGCGEMGSAILKGFIAQQVIAKENIFVSVASEASKQRIQDEFQVLVCNDNRAVVKKSDFVILAIKPQIFLSVVDEIKGEIKGKTILSIAAGISISDIHKHLHDQEVPIVRMMPNIPAIVGCAMTSMSVNEYVNERIKEQIFVLFTSLGEVMEVAESKINAIICVSGSSPAYVFMILDAMIQNGIKHGLTKEEATRFASQALIGAAVMVKNEIADCDTLKQSVCSLNGTTIEAVQVLEQKQLGEIIEQAMDACYQKAEAMDTINRG